MAAKAGGIVSLPASGGEAGLNRYLAEIKKFPILAPEEEYMLAKRWREHGDTEAAAKLVLQDHEDDEEYQQDVDHGSHVDRRGLAASPGAKGHSHRCLLRWRGRRRNRPPGGRPASRETTGPCPAPSPDRLPAGAPAPRW